MSLKEGYNRPNQLVFKAPVKEKTSAVVNGINLLENVPPRTENEVFKSHLTQDVGEFECHSYIFVKGEGLRCCQSTRDDHKKCFYVFPRSSCGCSSGSRTSCGGWRMRWLLRTCEFGSWSWSWTTWRTLAPTTPDLYRNWHSCFFHSQFWPPTSFRSLTLCFLYKQYQLPTIVLAALHSIQIYNNCWYHPLLMQTVE